MTDPAGAGGRSAGFGGEEQSRASSSDRCLPCSSLGSGWPVTAAGGTAAMPDGLVRRTAARPHCVVTAQVERTHGRQCPAPRCFATFAEASPRRPTGASVLPAERADRSSRRRSTPAARYAQPASDVGDGDRHRVRAQVASAAGRTSSRARTRAAAPATATASPACRAAATTQISSARTYGGCKSCALQRHQPHRLAVPVRLLADGNDERPDVVDLLLRVRLPGPDRVTVRPGERDRSRSGHWSSPRMPRLCAHVRARSGRPPRPRPPSRTRSTAVLPRPRPVGRTCAFGAPSRSTPCRHRSAHAPTALSICTRPGRPAPSSSGSSELHTRSGEVDPSCGFDGGVALDLAAIARLVRAEERERCAGRRREREPAGCQHERSTGPRSRRTGDERDELRSLGGPARRRQRPRCRDVGPPVVHEPPSSSGASGASSRKRSRALASRERTVPIGIPIATAASA